MTMSHYAYKVSYRPDMLLWPFSWMVERNGKVAESGIESTRDAAEQTAKAYIDNQIDWTVYPDKVA